MFALDKALMHESWLSEAFTLYTRIALTPSCWRKGTSRAQEDASAKGSMKVDGSEKGALGSLLTTPERMNGK